MNTYPDAYVQYLVHFHGDRDWFECHEILEEYWKDHPNDKRSRTWVGLIQVAVGLYHQRRGNRAGAMKMLESAERNLDLIEMSGLGLDPERTIQLIQQRRQEVELSDEMKPFVDLNLPIVDPILMQQCIAICRELGTEWQAASRMEEPELLHRHTLRDRSDVIEARRVEAERRRLQRGSEL